MKYSFSQRLAHFFHVVSNIRPVVWIGLYVVIIPIFALIYWALPDSQFRLPEGGSANYGSWIYYSIVTITTLGFGDYTPAMPGAQAVTAIEVGLGLIIMGLFLNAVGSMKSEIDVESEIEKQKALHNAMETEKLQKSIPMVLNSLNIFMAYCYSVTTPIDKREKLDVKYNPDFLFSDLSDMFEPSGLPFDRTNLPAVERLMHSSAQTSLALDSLQQRIDLTLWPQLLEDCFSFVANFQMFSNTDLMFRNPDRIVISDSNGDDLSVEKQLAAKIKNWKPDDDTTLDPNLKAIEELYNFIKENAKTAMEIETLLTELAMKVTDNK
ncbi:MAG: two pore domain potassium channel family protein [Muribaculaceae bacterium]|nr:two pore domain potassium channel family protein [Muribaculaceae bacterium]